MTEAVTTLTDADYDRFVTDSTRPVLVGFSAEWCTPCLTLDPVLEDLATEFHQELRVAKVDISDQPATAAALGVASVPTLLMYRDGVVVKRLFGAKTKRQLLVELRAAALLPTETSEEAALFSVSRDG